MKEIFNLVQDIKSIKFDFDTRRHKPEIEPTEMTETESKCLRLIAEFLPKEAHKITSPYKGDEQGLGYVSYVRHQQRLAIALAGIDPKSALQVVASMNEEKFPVQTFCAVAAIYEKNPSLCDEERVFAMAEKAFSSRYTLEYLHFSKGYTKSTAQNRQFYAHLTELCEAFIRINYPSAKEILRDIISGISASPKQIEPCVQSLVKIIRRIGIARLTEMKLDETLLDFLRIPIFQKNTSFVQSLAILAKTLVVFNQELAIEALASALAQAKEFEGQAKVKLLTDIAEAYAEFDQEKAIETAKEALTEILYDWDAPYTKYHVYRHRIFEFLRRITQLLLINDREYAISVLERHAEQMRLMDERVISSHLAATYPQDKEHLLSFDHFPIELFMGALEIYPHKALEMVNAAVEWARTITAPSEKTDVGLHKLSQILASSYPDQALEVANMIELDDYKLGALLAIVSKGSSLSDLD